jgi:hypothetical protein
MGEQQVVTKQSDRNQDKLDIVVENLQRINLVGRMLWELDDLDKVERGSLAIMLKRETDEIFNTLEEA